MSYQKVYAMNIMYAPVAQLVEHLTFNQRVEGSTPSGRTKMKIYVDSSIGRALDSKSSGCRFKSFSACQPKTIKINKRRNYGKIEKTY